MVSEEDYLPVPGEDLTLWDNIDTLDYTINDCVRQLNIIRDKSLQLMHLTRKYYSLGVKKK